MYVNIVHNDLMLTPLNMKSDLAYIKNDRDWMVIPIGFEEPKKRKNLENVECWHYDAHVNTCVVERMKSETRIFQAILNYFVEKFMAHMKTTEGITVHKKSLKL
jgi:hypothetical protein